jgi:hypothetical protein
MELADSIGIYWGPRRETAAECATRLAGYLVCLSREHQLLSQWYVKQRSRNAEKVPIAVPGDSARLIQMISSGRNRHDVGGDVMESLGFRVGLCNGASGEESAALSIKCGLYEENPNLGNAVVLTITPSKDADLANMNVCKRLLLCGVGAWQPDWGAIFFSGSQALQNRVGRSLFLDQVLWVKDGTEDVPNASRRELVVGGVLLER